VASVHVRTLSAKTMRMTESGLRSSRGASSANHDRVLGKSRLRIWASDESRVLRTVFFLWFGVEAPSTRDDVGPFPAGSGTMDRYRHDDISPKASGRLVQRRIGASSDTAVFHPGLFGSISCRCPIPSTRR
jgi:hypothetical protein